MIYSAVVRPTMLYGVQIWGAGNGDATPSKSMVKPLRNVQNKCLRRVLGAYKRTPIAALEREAAIAPLDVQLAEITLERTAKIARHPVTGAIQHAVNGIWKSLERRRPAGAQRGRRPRPQGPPPPTTGVQLYKTAVQHTTEIHALHAALRAEDARTYSARVAAWEERERQPFEVGNPCLFIHI